jgi:hypothetical protein
MVTDERNGTRCNWRRIAARHWKLLLAMALAAGALIAYVRVPELSSERTPEGSAYATQFRAMLWQYRNETGDYPRTAHKLVDEFGPYLASLAEQRLSFLEDSKVLLESSRYRFEMEYYYVSPDTPPTIAWQER